MKSVSKLLIALFILVFSGVSSFGQGAQLSFQGILKKSNGQAVDDGDYAITFALYDALTGGTKVWEETQPAVEVISGIYSVILGTVTPINAPFDTDYYLSVKIGSSELSPRFRLTTAPYALSLIGNTNKFPSTGTVKADMVRAKPGIPSDSVGYSFSPGGDQDGGLFSPSDGRLGLYVNNAIRIDLQTSPVHTIIYGDLTTNDQTINGNQTINGDINFGANGKVVFNGGYNDWRLVYQSDFSAGTDGWQGYQLGSPYGSSGVTLTTGTATINNPFVADKVLDLPNDREGIFKKLFNLAGQPHTEIKVEFTFYFLGSWDNEYAFAGFQVNSFDALTASWWKGQPTWGNFNSLGMGLRDKYAQGEMVAQYSGDTFYINIGADIGDGDEDLQVGNIKVWIR